VVGSSTLIIQQRRLANGGKIIERNEGHQANGLAPYASLVGFMRTSSDRSYAD
jgi:hypothetical protein